MTTMPPKQVGKFGESSEQKFHRLASTWRAETALTSSSTELMAHPACQEIIAMGTPAIPLVLRELENRTGHWHRVLRQITGADPVSAEDRGDIEKARAVWLRWGKEQGYEW